MSSNNLRWYNSYSQFAMACTFISFIKTSHVSLHSTFSSHLTLEYKNPQEERQLAVHNRPIQWPAPYFINTRDICDPFFTQSMFILGHFKKTSLFLSVSNSFVLYTTFQNWAFEHLCDSSSLNQLKDGSSSSFKFTFNTFSASCIVISFAIWYKLLF